jgi:glutamine amidotransferase
VKPSVVLLDYGAGNLRSVAKAFEHEGAEVTLTSDPAVARGAERLVLPGQGHFGQCMTRLEESGLGDAVREFIATERPFWGSAWGCSSSTTAARRRPASRAWA